MRMNTVSAALVVAAISLGMPAADAEGATDHGVVPLHDLGRLLGAPRAALPRQAAPPAGQPDALAWFFDDALLDPGKRAMAIATWREGRPVAILRGAPAPVHQASLQSLFGFASPAAFAIYQRRSDGTVVLHSLAELPTDAASAGEVGAQMARTLMQRAAIVHAGRSVTEESVEKVGLPRMSAVETQYSSSGNGASVTVEMDVVRDSSRSHDQLLVNAQSRHQFKPHHNGLQGDGKLIIPGQYTWYQRLSSVDNSGTSPTLTTQKPSSSSSTNIDITDKNTTTTSYGFGLSREVSAGLDGKSPNFGAKAAFNFQFGRQYTHERQYAMQVADYSLAASADRPAADAARTYWQAPVAGVIRSDPVYFGSRPTLARMTPSMRQITAHGDSEWRVPGTFAGMLIIHAGGSIDNLSYDGSRIEEIPDPRPQPVASLTFQATSPYLTLVPTVYIRSRDGDGGCLREISNNVVGLGDCPVPGKLGWEEDLDAQWQLDTQGRYYNRSSRRCMHILTEGTAPGGKSEIVTRPCDLQLSQSWEWQADRLHSRHGEGYPEWRLFVDSDNYIGVRTVGKPKYQPIPVNPFHPLLDPWSSYPGRPGSNDFVPKLGNAGSSQPISDEVRQLGAALNGERWEVIVLRQGLVR